MARKVYELRTKAKLTQKERFQMGGCQTRGAVICVFFRSLGTFMGLLDDVVSRVSQAISHGQASGLAQNVLSLLQESGGIQGLAQRFQEQGLGEVISSWIGTGANQPISAPQIINALGSDRVAALAQQAGIPPDQVSSALTQLLPTLIDKLTPNGQIPPASTLMQAGLSLLKNLA